MKLVNAMRKGSVELITIIALILVVVGVASSYKSSLNTNVTSKMDTAFTTVGGLMTTGGGSGE